MKTLWPAHLVFSLCFVAVSFPGRADVVNGDFSAGNTGFTSSYSFVASGTSTTPGTYGVRTNSQSFNPGYNLFFDHTSGSGNMMLVDGSSDTSAVVWQETLSVATNTAYIFSAWAAPANGSNPAGLIFSVNGSQVGGTLNLTNTPGVWQHFFAVWSSGNATNATLRITDNNSVALGNDFALDDLAFTVAPTNTVLTIYTAVEINWTSQLNHTYQPQFSTVLAPNSWSNLGPPIQGNGTNNSVFDSTRGQPVKFYRVLTVQ